MVEVRRCLGEKFLRCLEDAFVELFRSIVRDRKWLIVGDVLGDKESFPCVGKRDVLLLDLGIDHACLKLIVDWSVCGNSFVV